MVELNKPYVVSLDLEGLMTRWAQASEYTPPSPDFFKESNQELQTQLEYIFPYVEMISEEEIRSQLRRMAFNSHLPIISLDRAYVDDTLPNLQGYLDVTRAVNPNLESLGLCPRPNTPPIEDQIKAFTTPSTEPVVLLDDVVFGGRDIPVLSEKLAAVNRPVVKVIAGVGIQEGLTRIESHGIETEAGFTYQEVEDEICQRDFIACAPMSGRTVYDGKGRHWSAPYFRPYGNIEEWASIKSPDQVISFSQACLGLSHSLWSEIEKMSQRTIHTRLAPRRISDLEDTHSMALAFANIMDRIKVRS